MIHLSRLFRLAEPPLCRAKWAPQDDSKGPQGRCGGARRSLGWCPDLARQRLRGRAHGNPTKALPLRRGELRGQVNER